MYNKTDLEDFVESLYNSIHISNPDQLDMNEIAQKLNIEIFHSEFRSQAIRAGGHVSINLNTSLETKEAQWEVFGHELFHALKDVGNQVLFPVSFRQFCENKARNFALQFCVPTFMLDRLKWPNRNAISFITDRFHVTVPFATQRLEQYQNRITQKQIDDFEAMIREPDPPEYNLSEKSPETQRIMHKLKKQLEQKGERLEIHDLL